MSWVLIVLIHVGANSQYEANALTNVPGFSSKAQCETAGKATSALAVGTKKVEFVCVENART